MNESTTMKPLSMLIPAGFCFLIGWVFAGELSCRRHAKAENPSKQVRGTVPSLDRQLEEMRSVLDDTHKHIVAVSKALKIQPD